MAPQWPAEPQNVLGTSSISKQRRQTELSVCTDDGIGAGDGATEAIAALSSGSGCDADDVASFGSPGGGWAESAGAPPIDERLLPLSRSRSEELRVLQRQHDRRRLPHDTPPGGVLDASAGGAARAQAAPAPATQQRSEGEVTDMRWPLWEARGVGKAEGLAPAAHAVSHPLASPPLVAQTPTHGAPAAVANAVSRMEGLLLGDERETEFGDGWAGGWPAEEETW